MHILISTWLLVMTSSVVVFGSPMSSYWRALADNENSGRLLQRRSRSLLGGQMPCVTISYLNDLKGRFNAWLDLNDDGKSTPEEVKKYLQRFKDNIDDETVTSFIARRDLNHNGIIDFVPDYVQSVAGHDNTIEGANEWFHLQDTNDDGFVTNNELVRVGQALGMTEEEARENVTGYYMMVDDNGDGKLTFDEFKQLYIA